MLFAVVAHEMVVVNSFPLGLLMKEPIYPHPRSQEFSILAHTQPLTSGPLLLLFTGS